MSCGKIGFFEKIQFFSGNVAENSEQNLPSKNMIKIHWVHASKPEHEGSCC
ncbi:Uncharacterized protein dnm_035300 [Desulfonema magnum]|uniref:Uncharacterized protein n=1 Tax=Desulfonema magnum TaxID=45655 RepID=A0A975BL43_9BACT|nr:Uncharacterized protein dnm_035300 [Desulfonema magnum]